MTIQQLVEKYEQNHSEYLHTRYNETQVRSEFLDSFFELLGWDIKNVQGKSTNEREVILEESLRDGADTHSKKPDYTFRLFSERKFFVEAKKPSISIDSDPEVAKQVRRYGFTARLKISVLSNFEYLLIYDCSVPIAENDPHHKALISKYHFSEYVEKFDEIRSLIGRDSVYSSLFDEKWQSIEEQLKQFSVDKLFLNQINRWRLLLGKEIIRYQPAIRNVELNDLVQSYINRIIFLRVCEDRNIEVYRTLLLYADRGDANALISKFEEADRKYNSGLFEQSMANQVVRNLSSVFWTIIRELYYPESPYSFSVFSSDILGNIYEIFLSEKLARTGRNIILEKKPDNVDKDIITTPTFIIKDILRQTIIPLCDGKTDEEILNKKIADIACGSGAFLLEVFQLLNDTFIDYYLVHDTSKLIQTSLHTYKLLFDKKREILTKCIYGIDKDFNAVEAAKFGLLLKLLEDETPTTLDDTLPILPSLNDNVQCGNSLLSESDLRGIRRTVKSQINPFNFEENKFDVIVGNPPYMKSEDMKSLTKNEFPIYKKKYQSAHKQFDKYFLFIERSLELLRDDGYLGYIVPNKFTKVGAAEKLRHLISSNGFIQRMTSFGAYQIFESKTTYTCLLILRKSHFDRCEYFEVKSLSSWKVRNVDLTGCEVIPTEQLKDEGWVLIPSDLRNVHDRIWDQSLTLEKILDDEANISNGIQTSANDIYVIKPTRSDKKYYYLEKDSKSWKVEKALTRPYFETTGGIDNLNTYRPFKPNAIVIYPYKKVKGKIQFVNIAELKKKYPLLSKYLLAHKSKLADPKRDIKPEPETENEWYRYGRHQALDKCDVPEKIIVGVLSQGDKYAIDYHHTLISSGGTAGYCMIVLPPRTEYSIYYIQAILNSKYVEWYCSLIGEEFRGGYIAHGTKILKRLPIRSINFSNRREKTLHNKIASLQKKIISIQSQIDKNSRNVRLRSKFEKEFIKDRKEIDRLLVSLYGIGDDDKKIPLIKELYAAE